MAKQHNEFENVKTAILETSAHLFTQKGVHSTSLADIAKEAKLSKGTLYYYYQSKEHLISDVADYHIGRITDSIFSWIDALSRDCDPVEAITGLANALSVNEGLKKLHVVLAAEAVMGNMALQRKFSAKYREWTVMLEVGTLKIKSPEAEKLRKLTKIFVALLDGFLLEELMGVEKPNGDTLVDFIANI